MIRSNRRSSHGIAITLVIACRLEERAIRQLPLDAAAGATGTRGIVEDGAQVSGGRSPADRSAAAAASTSSGTLEGPAGASVHTETLMRRLGGKVGKSKRRESKLGRLARYGWTQATKCSIKEKQESRCGSVNNGSAR